MARVDEGAACSNDGRGAVSHQHSHGDTADIRLAFFLNLGFTLLEIVGGLLTKSIAILSDALHDLGDSLSLGIAWYLSRYSERGSDARFSYGYRRFSLLGALISTLILVVGSLYILSEAVPRLRQPELPNAPGMALFAVIGIAVNGFAALRLRGGRSMNAQAVGWHLMEDVLGWVAVLVVSIVLLFWDVPILDPLLSIAITFYVLFNVLRNLNQTVRLFLQGVPADVDIEAVEQQLQAIPGVRSTHHTHVWSLDGEHHVLSTHLVVDGDAAKAEICRIKGAAIGLVDDVAFEHTTIEIEYEDENCRMRHH